VSDPDLGPGQLRRGSRDRGDGVRSTVDDEPRIGRQVEDFAVDLAGNSVDRREVDAADVGPGSEPNGRGAQRHGGDSPSVAVSTRHHLEQPTVGRPRMLSRPYLAIRVTLANTRLSYSSRRPSDRTISTGVIGVIGVTVRGTERSSAIDPFRPFWPDRHQRRQLKHQPDRKSQPDQSKKASPLDPP
jgi:hypothetical protein